jgi:aspartate/methionine/tyrosine aminotransferase
MELEVWFDRYQYAIEYDIGESAVKTLAVGDIPVDLAGIPLRYGHHKGRPELREAIAAQYPGLNEENIVVTTGASEANFAVVSALVTPGDHVIVEHPNYPSLYQVPRSLGCEVTLFSLKFEERFKPDWEKLSAQVRPETRLVSLTHPNNPTGSMITEEELRKAVALAEERGFFLLFDETYRHMATGSALLPPAASLSDRAISISSMSKCYGLPGIRTGWLASGNRELLDRVLAIREQVSISNNAVSEVIAHKVLEKQEVFLDRARERIARNREVVEDWMRDRADFEWVPPEAGVVCLPRIKAELRGDPETVYRRLAETYRTFVVPGRCFEMDPKFFRIGFGAEPHEIRTGLSYLERALSDSMS